MQKLLATLTFFFIAGFAQASQIFCFGKYNENYSFTIQAVLDPAYRIDGDIAVDVKKTDGGKVYSLVLSPTWDDIRPREHIRFTGRNNYGTGTLSANYDAGAKSYFGRLTGQGGLGSVNVAVTCKLRKTRANIESR